MVSHPELFEEAEENVDRTRELLIDLSLTAVPLLKKIFKIFPLESGGMRSRPSPLAIAEET